MTPGITVRTAPAVAAVALWVVCAAPAITAQAPGTLTVAACAPCHGGGAAAAATAATPFPRLDGQHAEYLEKQLREFKSGKRTNPVMAPLIAALKKSDIPRMAAHFAGQAPARGTVENTDLAARGKTLYEDGNRTSGVPGCIGCHQANGMGAAQYPRLAGQLQAYTVQQLGAFKSGARNNDRAHVMRLIARRLTDDEIKAVAEYVAGLQ